MGNDTISVALEGVVSIADLARATAAFAALVQTLTSEADDERPPVEWVLDEAKGGSFSATIRGHSDTASGRRVITVVRRRWRDLGNDAHNGRVDNYSPQVRKHLEALTGLIVGQVQSVHLRVDNDGVAITKPIPAIEPIWQAPESFATIDYVRGSLRGRLTTLGDAKGLEFGLADPRTNTTVRCYPSERWADLVQANWRKWVVVEGTIHRERFTGKALTIQEITDIQPLKDDGPGAYRAARGCAPRKKGEEIAPEDAVRRVRNAERA